MNTGFFAGVWNAIAVRIQDSTGQLITALQGYVGTPFKLCVIAYLIVTLMIAAWSSDEAAFQRFFRQLWLAAIIFTVATTADGFNTYISGFANGLSAGITKAIAGIFGQTQNITANTFDIIAVKMFDRGGTVLNGLSWYSPKAWVLGMSVIGYWGISLGGTIAIFVIYLLSAIETNFVLSFGPLFVCLFFFPMTRRFFDGWISCVVGGLLVQIFTVGWLALFILSLSGMMATIDQAAQGNGGVNDIASQLMTLILAGSLVAIFSAMTTVSAFVAVRISGGIYTGLAEMVPVRFSGNSPAPRPASPSAGGLGLAGVNAGGSGPSGPPDGADPNREYAFNRHVGAAP